MASSYGYGVCRLAGLDLARFHAVKFGIVQGAKRRSAIPILLVKSKLKI